MPNSPDFYECFKYIRNQLRECRKDGAYIYMQEVWNRSWDKSVLEGHQERLPIPWHLLTILKWSVVYGSEPSTGLKPFDKNTFRKIYNKLNEVSIPTAFFPITDQINLWKFFRCLIFKQTPYQIPLGTHGLCAQKIILMDIGIDYDMSGKLMSIYGLNLEEYFSLNLLICGLIAMHPKRQTFSLRKFEPLFGVFPPDKIQNFINHISLDFDQLVDFMTVHHAYVNSPEREYYAITPLVEKPFLKAGERYVPYDQITTLLHMNYSLYDLFKKTDGSNFGQAFGMGFEKYVETPLKFLNRDFLSEEQQRSQYSTSSTIDYLVKEGEIKVGIECKSMEFHPSSILDPSYENLKSILGPFIIKAYTQIHNIASAIKRKEGAAFEIEKHYFIILTFKQVLFGSPLSNWDEFVKRVFLEKYGEDVSLDFNPGKVFLCSLYEFDYMVKYVSEHNKGIGETLSLFYNKNLTPQDAGIGLLTQFPDQTLNPIELPYLRKVHDSMFKELRKSFPEGQE